MYSIENPEFLKSSGAAGEGVIYFSPEFDPQSNEPSVKEFIEIYRGKYGEDPTTASAQSFDGIVALGLAMRECDRVESSCVKDALRQIQFDGASGQIAFDQDGNVSRQVEIKIVRNGRFEKMIFNK